MTETATPTGTPNLNKALAQLQASLPRITKDETANVRSDKGNYTYKYVNLASVSAEVLPKLGKHGLAFTSRPTLVDGHFGLVYELLHESGESLGGFYPLPASGTPQSIGSAITYARRYSLCAVTGVAPAEDDDDAQAANGQDVQMSRPRSAGEAFENAQPAARRQANGNGNGQVSRPVQQRPVSAPADPAEEGLVAEWGAKVDEITCQDDADKADAELREVFKAGKMSPATANAIRVAIRTKGEQAEAAKAAV